MAGEERPGPPAACGRAGQQPPSSWLAAVPDLPARHPESGTAPCMTGHNAKTAEAAGASGSVPAARHHAATLLPTRGCTASRSSRRQARNRSGRRRTLSLPRSRNAGLRQAATERRACFQRNRTSGDGFHCRSAMWPCTAFVLASAYRARPQPDLGALPVRAAARRVGKYRGCRPHGDVRLRGVENPRHLVAVELLPRGDHVGRDRRVLDLDYAAAGGHDVGPVRSHHHLAALWRDGALPAQVPFGHRLGPRVAVGAGVMRPVPDVDLPALRAAGMTARRAGALPARAMPLPCPRRCPRTSSERTYPVPQRFSTCRAA